LNTLPPPNCLIFFLTAPQLDVTRTTWEASKCRNKKREENRTFYTINIYPLANGDTIGEPSSIIKNMGLGDIPPPPTLS